MSKPSHLHQLSRFRYTGSSSKRLRLEGESTTRCFSTPNDASDATSSVGINSDVQSCVPVSGISRPSDFHADNLECGPMLTNPGFITLPPTPPQRCCTPVFINSSSDEESFPAAFSSSDEAGADYSSCEADTIGELIKMINLYVYVYL